MKWDKDSTFQLILALEQNPCLWQKSNATYKNFNKRADAYKAMAAMFTDCSEKDVKGTQMIKGFKQ